MKIQTTELCFVTESILVIGCDGKRQRGVSVFLKIVSGADMPLRIVSANLRI